jgi:hypothetical protein
MRAMDAARDYIKETGSTKFDWSKTPSIWLSLEMEAANGGKLSFQVARTACDYALAEANKLMGERK